MMIAAVDPNRTDLALLVRFLRLAYPGCGLVMFTAPQAAADYIRDHPIDVLFTEIPMLGMTGFQLQEAAEAVQPAVLTVFVTGTDAYAREAIRTRATGYIVKPVTTGELRGSLGETKFALAE